MGVTHHGGLSHGFVGHEGTFHLGGAQAVTADVDDVIDAARDPVVAVLVSASPIPREVVSRVLGEVGLLETLVVAVDRAGRAGPGGGEAKRARDVVAFDGHSRGGVHNHRLDAEKGQRGGTGLGRGDARQRRDEDAAGLRLPPSVHHGAAAITYDIVVPLPDLRIDGLTDGPEDAEGLAAVLLHLVIADRRQGP